LDEPDAGKKGLARLFEGLPYGATMLHEKRAALAAIGIGVLAMALGASVFAVGWWFKVAWLVETAFVITLLAWMLLVVSSAFWVVSTLAAKTRKK
jgi:hypothetical protein